MRNRLLVTHFLRRFLDNDLLSPDADAHVVLSFTWGVLLSLSLFVTVLIAPALQPPGRAAVSSLDDKFLYFAWSMIILSVLAVVHWHALALDVRDTLILGPLPIPHWTIVRAKLTAVLLLAGAFVAVVNAVPTVLYPFVLCAPFPIGLWSVLLLMAAHGTMAILAGAFGFLAMVGLREILYALFGAQRGNRMSPIVQGALMVFLITAGLLLPSRFRGVASWLAREAGARAWMPPLWFVGLHEAVAGSVIDRLPRAHLPPRLLLADTPATAVYRSLQPLLQQLATRALVALILVLAVALVTAVWNNRRLPLPPVQRATSCRALRHALTWAATHAIVRQQTAQAGFFFALQVLARSGRHRMVIAMSAAIALALIGVILAGRPGYRATDLASIPLSILALEILCLVALVTGFRHVVRVPAEVKANWTFHLAWSGDERPFLAGVKRAGLLVLILPAISLFFLWYLFMLGAQIAVAHVLVGGLVALLFMEGLFVDVRQMPFISAYAPPEHLKSVAALYVVGLLYAAFALAQLERHMFATAIGRVALIGSLATLLLTIRVVDIVRRRTRTMIDLDEPPMPPTQRLELVR